VAHFLHLACKGAINPSFPVSYATDFPPTKETTVEFTYNDAFSSVPHGVISDVNNFYYPDNGYTVSVYLHFRLTYIFPDTTC